MFSYIMSVIMAEIILGCKNVDSDEDSLNFRTSKYDKSKALNNALILNIILSVH